MTLIGALILVIGIAVMSAIPAAITAACTFGLSYGRRFRLAVPAWLAANVVQFLAYGYVQAAESPLRNVPSFLLIGVYVIGGFGALHFVRAGRRRAEAEQSATASDAGTG